MNRTQRKELLQLAGIMSVILMALCIHRMFFQTVTPKKYKVGVAKIIAVSPPAQGQGKRIYFVYAINETGELDTGYQRVTGGTYQQLSGIVGKSVPIRYDANNKNERWVLFTRVEFQKFHIAVNDSSLFFE